MESDLWVLCRVDVSEVFTGRRTARWALQFVERALIHPESITRAQESGGQYWQDWFGFDAVAARVLQNSNVTIASVGADQWLTGPRTETDVPKTLTAAFATLMS